MKYHFRGFFLIWGQRAEYFLCCCSETASEGEPRIARSSASSRLGLHLHPSHGRSNSHAPGGGNKARAEVIGRCQTKEYTFTLLPLSQDRSCRPYCLPAAPPCLPPGSSPAALSEHRARRWVPLLGPVPGQDFSTHLRSDSFKDSPGPVYGVPKFCVGTL